MKATGNNRRCNNGDTLAALLKCEAELDQMKKEQWEKFLAAREAFNRVADDMREIEQRVLNIRTRISIWKAQFPE